MGTIVTFAQRRRKLVMTGVAVAAAAGVAAAVLPAVADTGSTGRGTGSSTGADRSRHAGHGEGSIGVQSGSLAAARAAPSSPPA
ncbi:hypothetical protein [Streptomyces dioscori]|uniref:hypothetical protein n=1 Tax=Streptomyces dioscori TaxID=2109333 RepID=UPI001CEDE66D|nr:hypothetical protein [Streptomyces dioscori]